MSRIEEAMTPMKYCIIILSSFLTLPTLFTLFIIFPASSAFYFPYPSVFTNSTAETVQGQETCFAVINETSALTPTRTSDTLTVACKSAHTP